MCFFLVCLLGLLVCGDCGGGGGSSYCYDGILDGVVVCGVELYFGVLIVGGVVYGLWLKERVLRVVLWWGCCLWVLYKWVNVWFR